MADRRHSLERAMSFGRKKQPEGLHAHSRRDENGHWLNTCKPRRRRQKPTFAEKRLDARIKDFEKLKKSDGFHKPGSLKGKK
jgi:hypothetical protein